MKIQFVQSFIKQQFRSGGGMKRVLVSPVDDSRVCEAEDATLAQVDFAVDSAREAINGADWGFNSNGSQRRDLLLRLADLIHQNQQELAHVETLQGGKTITDSLADVKDSVNCFRFYAGMADKLYGSSIFLQGAKATSVRVPVGVCALITSYNYPLQLCAWKMAPALACGNSIILKPHQSTPLSVLILCDLVRQAQFPVGAVSALTGGGDVGGALANHPHIDKLSFTGSGSVGRQILKASAESNLKRVTLELGGKSPMIVFPDAVATNSQLEKVAGELSWAIFTNAGQNCCAGSKLFIHQSVFDRVIAAMYKHVKTIRVGDPMDATTQMGPLVDKAQFERVMSVIQDAKVRLVKLLTGGERYGTTGYLIQPTIFTDVADDDPLAVQEIFGPVLAVMRPFNDVDEVVRRANSDEFGLAAGVWTHDTSLINRVTGRLHVGTTWVNGTYNIIHPQMIFGGLRQSGIGSDLGMAAAINEWTVGKVMYEEVS